mmetsp:Transcript_17893/g.52210  ORF Transcript_17893/g.52210 Transcript_17893/m.52210 type:complete len:643 (+) Transcript_17893:251-2179(+)
MRLVALVGTRGQRFLDGLSRLLRECLWPERLRLGVWRLRQKACQGGLSIKEAQELMSLGDHSEATRAAVGVHERAQGVGHGVVGLHDSWRAPAELRQGGARARREKLGQAHDPQQLLEGKTDWPLDRVQRSEDENRLCAHGGRNACGLADLHRLLHRPEGIGAAPHGLEGEAVKDLLFAHVQDAKAQLGLERVQRGGAVLGIRGLLIRVNEGLRPQHVPLRGGERAAAAVPRAGQAGVLAVEPQDRADLRARVQLLLGALVGQALVQEQGYGLRDDAEANHQELDAGDEGRGERQLPGPREDRGGQDLAAQEHEGHRDQHRQERRHELVEEDGQRLVGKRIEEQQGHQQQVVVLEEGQDVPGCVLLLLEPLALLIGDAIVEPSSLDDLHLFLLERHKAHGQTRGQSGPAHAQDRHHNVEPEAEHSDVRGVLRLRWAEAPRQGHVEHLVGLPVALRGAVDRNGLLRPAHHERALAALQRVLSAIGRAPRPCAHGVVEFPAVHGPARAPVILVATVTATPEGAVARVEGVHVLAQSNTHTMRSTVATITSLCFISDIAVFLPVVTHVSHCSSLLTQTQGAVHLVMTLPSRPTAINELLAVIYVHAPWMRTPLRIIFRTCEGHRRLVIYSKACIAGEHILTTRLR